MPNPYQADIEAILAHRRDNGADDFLTPDGRLLKGAPFTALESAMYLLELGVPPEHEVLQSIAARIVSGCRADGRIRIAPTGAAYPCQTALALNVLCHMGYDNAYTSRSFAYFLNTQQPDGGWKCNKYSFGRGEETECSTPYTTLVALDAFRFSKTLREDERLDKAAAFLLRHWEVRRPISPCHYGIGSRFMQVEYPFRGYNLFYYVYVLSFYKSAVRDPRFIGAMSALEAHTTDGRIVVERVVPKLARLRFCEKGKPSALATQRYEEIRSRVRA